MESSKICVSIGNIKYHEVIEKLEQVPFAEIRIDLLNFDLQQIESIFRSHSNLIATYRKGSVNESTRNETLIKCLEWGAAFVDIEIETEPKIRESIVDIAHKLNKKVITSYHNFEVTPDVEELYRITDSLFAAGGDIAKISCMVNTPEDNARILGLYANYNNLLALGMGSGGIITRVIAPLMGAPFTIASLPGNETAPGQIEEKELKSIVELLESYVSGK